MWDVLLYYSTSLAQYQEGMCLFMRIGIYVRVSTDEQAKEGYSIPAQLRMLNAWAVVKGATDIIEYVDDGYSAKNLRRPAVQRLIADCKARKLDTVIIWRLDRFSRNLRDMLVTIEDVFKTNNVEFVSATENIDTSTPSGRLTLNILGSVAQNERENTSERTSMVMNELAKQGKHLGGRPLYGYAVDQDMHYVLDPARAEAVRLIFRMRAAGHSYPEIIAALDAAGHKTYSGKSFTKNTIYDMLLNEKYTGVYIYNRATAAASDGSRNNRTSKPDDQIIRIPGGMPAIITREEWIKVNQTLKHGKELGGKNSAKNVYILSGLVYCGKCGSKMTIANGGRNRDGSYWRVYRCKDKCVHGIEYKKLDRAVMDYLKSLACDPAVIDSALAIAESYCAMSAEDSTAESAELHTRLAESEKARNNIVAFVAASGSDAPQSLLDEIKKYDALCKDLRAEIALCESRALAIDRQKITETINRIQNIDSLPDAEKKAAVASLVGSVTIYEDRVDIDLTTTAAGGADPIPTVLVIYTAHIARPTQLKRKNHAQ